MRLLAKLLIQNNNTNYVQKFCIFLNFALAREAADPYKPPRQRRTLTNAALTTPSKSSFRRVAANKVTNYIIQLDRWKSG